MSKGKRHAAAADLYDRDHHHTGREALDLVKSFPGAKFDESVDVAIRLSVDPRKTEEMVRGTVALPSGTGKDVRVAVFAQGAAATAAREAGADHVGALLTDTAAAAEMAMCAAEHSWSFTWAATAARLRRICDDLTQRTLVDCA